MAPAVRSAPAASRRHDRPVPDAHDPARDRRDIEFVTEPGAGCRHGGWNIGDRFDLIGTVRQRIAVWSARAKPGTGADAVHLSLDLPPQPAPAFHLEYLKLHAGGSGIDDKDRVHGGHAAAIGA